MDERAEQDDATSNAARAASPARLLINIDVDDLEHALRFYTEGLNFSFVRRFAEGWLELNCAGIRIFLLSKEADTTAGPDAGPRSYRRHWTPVHLDIVVDDIEAARLRALAAGAKGESDILTQVYGRLALFSDPFGHGFCLIEFNAQGYDALATE